MNIKTDYWESPIGTVKIIASDTGLFSVKFITGKETPLNEDSESSEIIERTKIQLEEYFSKKRTFFELSIDLTGTEFQKKVWAEVLKIPFGQTITYTQLAKRLGSDRFVRSVGTANGKNPLWLIIPCHRVVGAKGELTGYAGGLWRKQWLLEHENRNKMLM